MINGYIFIFLYVTLIMNSQLQYYLQFFIIRNINKFYKFKKNKIARGRPLKKYYSYILNKGESTPP